MRSLKQARPHREQGAVAIMVALMLVVLMAAVALAVDAGGLYLRRRELVNGADAAALSAARTCARGTDNDLRFATPEEAADYQVQENAPILPLEVAGTNITSMAGCGQQYGHVSVQYTSQQALYFSPALGFDHESPVTTAATASWGLGSNNPVPMVLSDLFKPGACSMPPAGKPSIGAVCAFWYDNDSLGGGNFTFLSLDPHGWDVTPTASCNQAGGTNQLTDWITGEDPASVTLNWTDPTYVCSDGGIKGVGNNPNSLLWSSVLGLKGQTRDFPINWEGPGAPIAGATPQGTVFKTNGDSGQVRHHRVRRDDDPRRRDAEQGAGLDRNVHARVHRHARRRRTSRRASPQAASSPTSSSCPASSSAGRWWAPCARSTRCRRSMRRRRRR